MRIVPANVKIDEIDLDDLRFSIGDTYPQENLRESVEKFDIITPPTLLKTSGKKGYVVVSGHRRIRAAAETGVSEIAACVLEGTTAEAMVFAVTDHSFNKKLTLTDKATMIKHSLDMGMSNEEVQENIMPALGLEASQDMLDRILFLDEICPPDGSVNVSLSALSYLARLGRDAAQCALALFCEIKPNNNYQKEILLLVEEISLREGVPAEGVVREELEHLVETEMSPRARRIEAVRDRLRRRRFPRISAKEEEFDRAVNDINAGPNVTWQHEPGFEESSVKVTFSFENEKDFEGTVKKLLEALKSGKVKRLTNVCKFEVKISRGITDINDAFAEEEKHA